MNVIHSETDCMIGVDADCYPLEQLMKQTESSGPSVVSETNQPVRSDLRNFRSQNSEIKR